MSGSQKILITGANGLLGRHVIMSLRNGHDIFGVIHNEPDKPLEGVEYIEIDFNSGWNVNKLPHKIDLVVHLAQSNYYREFPDKAIDIFNVNIDSTAKLLDYSFKAGASKFIYASSGGVYGAGNTAFDENSPINEHGQLGYYLGSKLCGEILVQNYESLMDTMILRFFFMYGQGQKKSMLIPRLIENVKSGRTIYLQGKEGIRINPIHVSDSVKAMEGAIELDGSYIINVAGPEVLSLKQIGIIIGNAVEKEPLFEKQVGDPNDLIANIETMKKKLVEPEIVLKDGIKDLL